VAKKPLVGTWRLVSLEIKSADGQVQYPYGQDPVGYLMYDKDGYMSVSVMAANRPKCNTEHIVLASTEEKAMAADTYESYCGRYEMQGNRVIHHVQVSLFQDWVGGRQERTIELSGNTLSFSSPATLFGSPYTAIVLWKRVLAPAGKGKRD